MMSYMKQNKKRKQTLKNAQYGLEIIFKPTLASAVRQSFTANNFPLRKTPLQKRQREV